MTTTQANIIRIDRKRCIGSGSCQFFAPNTFELDAACKAVIINPDGDDLAAIRSAAQGCPMRAIDLIEDRR